MFVIDKLRERHLQRNSPYARDDTAKPCAYADDLDGLVFVDREIPELEGVSRSIVLTLSVSLIRNLSWHAGQRWISRVCISLKRSHICMRATGMYALKEVLVSP